MLANGKETYADSVATQGPSHRHVHADSNVTFAPKGEALISGRAQIGGPNGESSKNGGCLGSMFHTCVYRERIPRGFVPRVMFSWDGCCGTIWVWFLRVQYPFWGSLKGEPKKKDKHRFSRFPFEDNHVSFF